MPKLYVLYFILTLAPFSSYGQNLFYQDIFYGGVTAGGFSTGQGSGSGSFNLYIEPGSTIKQAYLFTYRQGYPPNIPITINGTPYLFDTTNSLYDVNHSSSFASPNNLYYYDFTDSLNTNITSTFNVTIPSQPNLPINWGYWTIYVYIAYEHPSLPSVATALWINDQDFTGGESYTCSNLNPIDNGSPVGLGLFTDRACNHNTDGNIVFLNINNIGIIGGADAVNSLWGSSGAKGHFYYQNNSLFGLDDDVANNLMDSTDALADISGYLINNDTTYNLNLFHNNNSSPGKPNITPLWVNAYTTPCDTFTTTITANDTICFGDSLQLQATGGAQYSWFGAFGGLSDTSIANPKASPPQTTTYIVTITNDSGCVKTEQVKIWVNPLPIPDTLITTPNNCGDSVGSITVGNISSGNSPFTYTLTNLQSTNSTTQNTNLFDSLVAGNYELQIIDANGCQWLDTITVKEVNNVNANFTANPSSGIAPLDVTFSNTSANANNFEWTITNSNGDTLYWIPTCVGNTSNCGFSYTFDSSGTYQVCLVAYNNIPTCADTICKTIVVEDEISFIIPNVFTPNGDGDNDNFVIQLTGAALIKSFKAEVFNRWGQLMVSHPFLVAHYQQLTIWDGYTTAAALAPKGTYFYVISYQTLDGETKNEKGSLSLLR